MKREIKWQTGVPKEEGEYLVTLQTPNGNEVVCINFEEYGWFGNGNCKVIAWCPLSEIEPYMEREIKVGTNLYRYVSSENGFIEKYVVTYVEEHPDDEDIKPYFGVMTEKDYENIEEKYRLSFAYNIRDIKEFITYNSMPLDFDNYQESGFFLTPGLAINEKIKIYKNHIKRLEEIYRNYK